MEIIYRCGLAGCEIARMRNREGHDLVIKQSESKMKKLLFVIGALLVQQGFAGNLVNESAVTDANCGSDVTCQTKKFAHVCIQNFDSKHHLAIRTSWGKWDNNSMANLPLGTRMIFRLVTPAELKDTKFTVTYLKNIQTKEVAKADLDVAWLDVPSVDCSKLPTYNFTAAKNTKEEVEISLVKELPKP